VDARESDDMITAGRSEAFHPGESRNVEGGDDEGPWGQGVGAVGDDVEGSWRRW
jgi:hypothetical protein